MAFFAGFALIGIVAVVAGIVTAVDVAGLPDTAFERAGTSKTLWIVLPLIGIVACGLISLIAAVMWFGSYKPRVVAASGGAG